MKFIYSKLLGRMKECGFTQEELAKAIGLSKGSLNAKLKNLFYFTARDIYAICEVLHIPTSEIGEYFFCCISSVFQNQQSPECGEYFWENEF